MYTGVAASSLPSRLNSGRKSRRSRPHGVGFVFQRSSSDRHCPERDSGEKADEDFGRDSHCAASRLRRAVPVPLEPFRPVVNTRRRSFSHPLVSGGNGAMVLVEVASSSLPERNPRRKIEQGVGRALPLSYLSVKEKAGLEPATTRLGGEVTLISLPGNWSLLWRRRLVRVTGLAPASSPFRGESPTIWHHTLRGGKMYRPGGTHDCERSGPVWFLALADRRAATVIGPCDEHETGDGEPRDHEGNSDHDVVLSVLRALLRGASAVEVRATVEPNACKLENWLPGWDLHLHLAD